MPRLVLSLYVEVKMLVGKVKNRAIIKRVIILGLCVSFGWYLKGRLTPQIAMTGAMGGQTPHVLIQQVEKADVSPRRTYIASVEPIKSVNLKPQVTGYIEKVLFEEGGFVREGDILFVIEQERYIATVELRQAELDSAKANLVRAERDYKRQKSLSKQNISSKATMDSSESTYLQAKAAVKQASANLELAKIELGYTEIKAPISGQIGKALVTEGNYVASTLQTLARIVQTKPIRVAFSVTDKEMLTMRQTYGDNSKPISAEVVLPNGTIFKEEIRSHFADNEVNAETATVAVYLEYDNADKYLIPGNYVNIRIGTTKPKVAILVPQAAMAQDEHGNYVMVVNDNVVEQRRVTTGEIVEDKQVVLEGLDADDKVIIQGLQKVRDGQNVKASLVNTATEVK